VCRFEKCLADPNSRSLVRYLTSMKNESLKSSIDAQMHRETPHSGWLTGVVILLTVVLFCPTGAAFSSWPDFWLSSDCFSGPAPGPQTTASVAFDGTSFLVVWEDERNAEKDVFGARVSLQGEILDPIGIPVCTSQNVQSNVDVVWGGENYLVVWQDWREGTWMIYGTRVDQDGNVLDPDGFPIAGGAEWVGSPAVASDGTNFFVVWSHDKPETFYDLYGTRITPDGNVLDPEGILICATYQYELNPSVAYNGSIYFVAWEHDQG
jgi:hypothetical protein